MDIHKVGIWGAIAISLAAVFALAVITWQSFRDRARYAQPSGDEDEGARSQRLFLLATNAQLWFVNVLTSLTVWLLGLMAFFAIETLDAINRGGRSYDAPSSTPGDHACLLGGIAYLPRHDCDGQGALTARFRMGRLKFFQAGSGVALNR